jgi:hypothetical protein
MKRKDKRPEEEKKISELVDPNEPGLKNSILKEVAHLTYQQGMRVKVMTYLLKTIRDRMKHDIKQADARAANKVRELHSLLVYPCLFSRVSQGLNVLEYLIKNGSVDAVNDILDNRRLMDRLTSYNNQEQSKYEFGNNIDCGATVRKKAKEVSTRAVN